jgi:twinkle protein
LEEKMLGSEFEAALRQKMINREGQHKVPCPSCQHTRTKNKSDKPLSVNIDHEKIIYHCHHCEAEGLIPFEKSRPVKKTNGNGKAPSPPLTIKQDFSLKSEQWLNDRGISVETAESCGCLIIDKNNKPVIGFAYPQDDSDKYEAVKWRSANGSKNFWWENSANKLWGRQVYNDSLETIEDTIVITEGEMDMLAIKESFKDHSNIDVYSVPNGAPNKITDKKIDPSEDGRFRYIWEERERFNVKRIILATDADIAGDALADELSRRLNKAKCYRVDYKGHKDANDLLINADAETVRNQVLGATPIPLHGLNSIEHYADEFQSLYDQGKPKGVSTGIKSVDKLFTLATGNLVVVTGYPGDGKSAWLNDIVISVGKNYGWKTCFCSFRDAAIITFCPVIPMPDRKAFFLWRQSENDARRGGLRSGLDQGSHFISGLSGRRVAYYRGHTGKGFCCGDAVRSKNSGHRPVQFYSQRLQGVRN